MRASFGARALVIAVAAGSLLVREAGGVVSDLDGREGMMECGNVLAANDALHKQLLDLLHGKA